MASGGKKKNLIINGLETEVHQKERWTSIYIIYYTMFSISLGFSIIITGVFPYLDKLDPTAGKEFMGYVVAANPFAQMLLSPLVGFWSNKLGSIRLPMFTSLILFIIASAIYSSLELFDSYRKYWMLFSRLLVGVSSANIAACRSYVSSATTLSERTKAVSMISLAQVLGFILGPALQALVVFLGSEGVWIIESKIKLNMFTAAGWINVLLSILNIFLFTPYFFKEHKVAAKELMLKQGLKTEKETYFKPDYISAWTLIVAFFVLVFNFMLLETLGTPLTMDQFAWSKAESLYYMGILMTVGGVSAIFCFAAINPLCRYFPEHKVLIWGGFLLMVIGRLIHIPWGDHPPQVYNDTRSLMILNNKNNNATYCDSILNKYYNFTNDNNGTNTDLIFIEDINVCNGTESLGCPLSQTWCTYTRQMTIFQFIAGYILTVFGYPIGVTLIQTIFSKVLGPKPQGVWMGLLTGSGCLSRVLGPVFVSYIYTEYGTNWTFGFTAVMMAVSFLWLLYFKDKLVFKEIKVSNEEEGQELNEVNSLVEVPLKNSNQGEVLST